MIALALLLLLPSLTEAATSVVASSRYRSNILPNVYAAHVHPHVACAEALSNALTAAGCQVIFRTDVQSPLMSMCSYEIMNNCDHASAISGVEGFVASYTVRSIARPKDVVTTNNNTITNTTSTTSTAPFNPQTEAIHNITGVLDARYKLGLTGEGINVAIIDTGVYYLHPALGGGFGPGFKVAFGYDLVGDDYDETASSIAPDDDPLDNCSSVAHGTFVAGVVAANATNITTPGFVTSLPFTGVAPGVTLSAYRVFGCTGFTTNDILTAAIIRAAKDGADIINLSLAAPGYADDIHSVAAEIVKRAGHIVVASISNEGTAGAYVAGDPAVSFGAIGAASFDNVNSPSIVLYVDGTPHPYSLGILNGSFAFNVPYPGQFVVNTPNAAADHAIDDGCSTINVNVTGKAVLLFWGLPAACGAERCNTAAAAGAAACIIYYQSDDVDFNIFGGPIPSFITTLSAGLAIISDLSANKTPVVIPTQTYVNFPAPTGGTLSSFSSPGLSNDLFLKPDLGGIGGNVLSTISPFAAQSQSLASAYDVYSGTSFSSPYVAGCIALLLQKKGKIGFDTARAYLQNTATVTKIYNTSTINPPAYQGAGLVNIYKAATTGTLVSPPALSLNDTANHKTAQSILIENNYDPAIGPITYHLSHMPAATANTFNAGDDYFLDQFTTTFTTNNIATVLFVTSRTSTSVQPGTKGEKGMPKVGKSQTSTSVQPGTKGEKGMPKVEKQGGKGKRMLRESGTSTYSVTIKPGKSATIHFNILAPVPASADLWPTYGGYIAISNSFDNIVTHVPYAGVAGVWKNRDMWARNSTSLYSRWALGNPTGIAGLFGTTPASTGTGLYADTKFIPLSKMELVNATSSSYILAPVASTSRSANITITYLCNDDTALRTLGLQRTSFVAFTDVTAFVTTGVQQPYTYWQGITSRTTYADAEYVRAPHVFGFDGTVVTNIYQVINDDDTFLPAGATTKLPAGIYQMNFVAKKNLAFNNNNGDLDVITTPPFQLVYTTRLSSQALADCQI